MGKTLLIGFYDYSYSADAFELEDNKIKPITLKDEEFEAIYRNDCAAQSIYDKYEHVITCDNGWFEVIK